MTETPLTRVDILNERDDFGGPVVNRVIMVTLKGHPGVQVDPETASRLGADLIAAVDETRRSVGHWGHALPPGALRGEDCYDTHIAWGTERGDRVRVDIVVVQEAWAGVHYRGLCRNTEGWR